MFARIERPVLNTGMRSAHWTNDACAVSPFGLPLEILQLAAGAPPSRDQRKSGGWLLVYATPASKNGDTSTGRNEFGIKPNSGEPSRGIRNSVFATRIRLPNSRSSTGQLFGLTAFADRHSVP